MRCLLQRVTRASVHVGGELVAEIGPGLLILAGIAVADTAADVQIAARKITRLRVFASERGTMDRSILEIGGEILLVSQFTLLAGLRKGNRPSFTEAAAPEQASMLLEFFRQQLENSLARHVAVGRFGAHMEVRLANDGPVTVWVDTRDFHR